MEKCGKMYFVGGGIAALAGACFAVLDGGMRGEDVVILEELPVLGGSNDGAGNAFTGYTLRGGRMWNRSTYENTWELFDRIPAAEHPGKTLKREIFEFDDANPTCAGARLVDKDGRIVDVSHLGLSRSDRRKITGLVFRAEKNFEDVRIEDYFGEGFFTSNFWLMFSTTFAFNPWHSVLEMRRYLRRFLHELPKLHTLAAVARTPYNQYDSVTLPMQRFLQGHGVRFRTNCVVTDIDLAAGEGCRVTALRVREGGEDALIPVAEDEAVIVTNGCMTDTHSWGDMDTPPSIKGKGNCFALWERMAARKQGLGNPVKFDGNVRESAWGSWTVTFKGSLFFDEMRRFSGNRDGTGALVTCKDSPWLMSMVLAKQPHFREQPKDVTVAFGICYRPYAKSGAIGKPFFECTGREILGEWLDNLRLGNKEEILASVIDCKPLFTPMGIAQFMNRNGTDRPKVIPDGSVNLAFVGQFCEVPDDVVFTEEYSVRSARMAVVGLLGLDAKIAPVTPYLRRPMTLLRARRVIGRKPKVR